MKKSILITPILLIIFGIKVLAGIIPVCYVKSADRTYFGQKLKFGLTNVKVISDDGAVVKVPIKEVNSYKNGNRYFELRPTVNQNFEINGAAMMEFIKTKCDLTLYRCIKNDGGTPVYEYYVFKNGGFHLLLDLKNASTVLSFFELNANIVLV